MANMNCSACEDLRQNAPNLVLNGIGTTECNSLKNDTGLSPSNSNNDCTDLEDLNDCLVGNMEHEVDSYDVCEWKDYIKKLIPNIWTVFKAIICAICGLWTNIHNIWTAIRKLQCLVDVLFEGISFSFDEQYEEGSGDSYIVAGKGASFANVGSGGTSSDISLVYVGGGTAILTGSLKFYTEDFTDAKAVRSFDTNGTTTVLSANRKGNDVWDSTGKPITGGELIYELRLRKSQYPQFESAFTGLGAAGAGGSYNVYIRAFQAGQYAYGQHGWCDTNTGNPAGTGSDRGHEVPNGWVYIQVRANYIDLKMGTASGNQLSPICIVPMRVSQTGSC